MIEGKRNDFVVLRFSTYVLGLCQFSLKRSTLTIAHGTNSINHDMVLGDLQKIKCTRDPEVATSRSNP